MLYCINEPAKMGWDLYNTAPWKRELHYHKQGIQNDDYDFTLASTHELQ
jgi:hypothetical protein